MPTRMERRQERMQYRKRDMMRWAAEIAVVIVIVVLLRTFVFGLITVEGPSMMDTLDSGQVVIVDKTFFKLHSPKPGLIVICRYPGQDEMFVKRVIALPGDEVEIKDGVTYVNGVPRDEEYITFGNHEDFGPYTVAEGCVFVMGDNRANSHDSRAEGAISQERLVGRVFAVFLPLSDAHFLPMT